MQAELKDDNLVAFQHECEIIITNVDEGPDDKSWKLYTGVN